MKSRNTPVKRQAVTHPGMREYAAAGIVGPPLPSHVACRHCACRSISPLWNTIESRGLTCMPELRSSPAEPFRTTFFLSPVIAGLLILAWGFLWWQYTVDDTFITLRYAGNLAQGNGVVFNPGDYTEGYSSTVWVFVLAGIARLGFDTLAAAKVLGLLASLSLCLLMYFVLHRMSVDPPIRFLTVLVLATIPGLHIHGVSGMETLPFALSIAVLIALPLLTSSPHLRNLLLPPLLLLIAAFRPEGVLLFAAASAVWIIRAQRSRLRILVILAWVALILLFVLRYWYYGSLLPNTWMAKPSPLLHHLTRDPFSAGSMTTLIGAFGHVFLAFPGGLVGAVFLLPLMILPVLRRQDLVRCSAIAAALTGGLFVTYAAEDWMPGYRFALPYQFPLLLLAAIGVQSVLHGTKPGTGRQRRGIVIAVAAMLFVYNTGMTAYWFHRYRNTTVNPALDAAQYAPIGTWLKRHSSPGDRILAYEVGAVSYYSERSVVDYEGLVTREVANIVRGTAGYDAIRYGGDTGAMRRIVAYCVAQDPDYLLIRSSDTAQIVPGRPLDPVVASEAIQRALVAAFGSLLTVRTVFPLKQHDTTSRDRYVLLGRRSQTRFHDR